MTELSPSTSYEMLRALLEALDNAQLGCTVVATHPDRLVRVYANEALARIYGVDVEAMQGLDVYQMLTQEQRERLMAVRAAVARGDERTPSTITSTIQRADGKEVPIELGLGYASVGGATVALVLLRDIERNAQMEEALRESEDRFRRLAEASPDMITVFADGRYLYANRRALAHLGLSSLDDLAVFDPWSSVPVERREGILAEVARLERGEHIPPLMHRVRTAAGEEVVLESSLSLMRFAGRPALVSCTRDITERMQLQAELMKRDRLASVGLLAAGVAHEVNNPLTALSLQASLLRTRAGELDLPEDVHASIGQIEEAAKRMSAIIGDLLFMARPVEDPQAHVDVAAIIASTISLLKAGRAKVPELVMRLEDVPPIRGWASKLAQVFFNVLRNALQAVEDREHGEIRVTTRVDGERVVISIADNGPGIPRDVLPRIAQPFFTTRPGGTGLGLWMSQSIMALHGGTLRVEGAPGEGTTIVLVLPIGNAPGT